jgi:hypothetical protein
MYVEMRKDGADGEWCHGHSYPYSIIYGSLVGAGIVTVVFLVIQ